LCELGRLALMLAFMIWPLQSTRLWRELVGVAALIAVTGAAPAQSLLVPVGEARTIKLETDANTAVIGDIDIADARIAFGDTVVLIGKHQGTSNLIVYDDSGREIHNSTIMVVSASDKNVVALITGSRRTILDCSPALCIERREPDSLSETEVVGDGEVSTRTETQRQ
jgi:Flp pilus assembly secretin CpaC